jgi:hypothetical protein
MIATGNDVDLKEPGNWRLRKMLISFRLKYRARARKFFRFPLAVPDVFVI